MKVNNFSAGPSKIPNTVVNQVSKDILDYQNLGLFRFRNFTP